MDLNEHLKAVELTNRKLFSATHLLILCLVFCAITLCLVINIDPLWAVAFSGFVAFFMVLFYVRYAFKKINNRITLLETKINNDIN